MNVPNSPAFQNLLDRVSRLEDNASNIPAIFSTGGASGSVIPAGVAMAKIVDGLGGLTLYHVDIYGNGVYNSATVVFADAKPANPDMTLRANINTWHPVIEVNSEYHLIIATWG